MDFNVKKIDNDFEVVREQLVPQEKFQCYCNEVINYTDLPDTREIQCPKCGLFWYVWDDGVNRGIEEVI